MNPALQYRDQIGRLSGDLQNELDQLVANVGTGWATEHDADGHHTSINASGSCTCRQLRLRGFVELDLHGGGGGTPLEVPAGVTHVAIITPNSGLPYEVYGIR